MMKAYSIDPQTAKLLKGRWVFEIKYDGIRQFWIDGRLFSEKGKDYSKQFPHIRKALDGLNVVLDGEIYIPNGTSSDVIKKKNWKKVRYVLFDILMVDNREITQLPLFLRRKILVKLYEKYLKDFEFIELSRGFFDFERAWNFILKNDLEGLVAKNLDSEYKGGVTNLFKVVRSWNWLKIKNWKEGKDEVIDVIKGKPTKYGKGVFVLKCGVKLPIPNKEIMREYEELKKFGKVFAEFYYLKKSRNGKFLQPKLKRLTLE